MKCELSACKKLRAFYCYDHGSDSSPRNSNMLVNADFTRPAIVTPSRYQWVASPSSGVERVMLDRVGGEVARATSIVRYAPRSSFPAHRHPGGEEILVLSGTFSADDEHSPAGFYLRNPPGSMHQPASLDGTTIFVKLMQMSPTETESVRIDTRDPGNWRNDGCREDCQLFTSGTEAVSLQRLPAGTPVFSGPVPSVEFFLLEGGLQFGALELAAGTWMRLPAGEYPEIVAGVAGATFYLKVGVSVDMHGVIADA
ncbi:MAG: cupin domain-containing protein [Sphingomonadaceae bacterium]